MRDNNHDQQKVDALRDAERKLRDIVEHSTNLFYMHTADHILTYMSPQSRQFFDCEPEEALVRWTEFMTDHPANLAAIEATQRAIDTGERQPPYQVECIGKQGRKIWAEVNETPLVENGKTVAVVGSLTDITERRRAEQEREQLLVQFNAVLDSIHEGVVIADLKGNILTMNQSALSIHGYDSMAQARQKLRQYLKTFELFDRDGSLLPYEQWPLARVLRGERFADWDLRVRRKDNGQSWIGSYSGTPVRNQSGDIILSVITLRDVTERKRIEEEIVRLNADLAARADELEIVNRELEAFNYTVAHDLRKPLTTISGFCQMLQEMSAGSLDTLCQNCLQEILDGTWRMNQLIDTLLDFSQLVHVEPNREKVDLSALARPVAAELQMIDSERRVTFRIAESISVEGDASLLRVVLDNLFSNAWKYTGTREEGIIELGMIDVDGETICYVRDNGSGFDMADAKKLFTPFQRLSGAETCNGFGIGLATAERIIRRHGGRIWAEGEKGQGATFYFTLGSKKAFCPTT